MSDEDSNDDNDDDSNYEIAQPNFTFGLLISIMKTKWGVVDITQPTSCPKDPAASGQSQSSTHSQSSPIPSDMTGSHTLRPSTVQKNNLAKAMPKPRFKMRKTTIALVEHQLSSSAPLPLKSKLGNSFCCSEDSSPRLWCSVSWYDFKTIRIHSSAL